jgi:type IV pilus assembly protein PilB
VPDRRRLGEILVDEELATPGDLARAVAQQAATVPRRRVGEMLVSNGVLSTTSLAEAVAIQSGVGTVDPLEAEVDLPLLWRVPRDVAERFGALLVRGPDGPLLAIADPNMPGAIRTVASHLGLPTLPVAVGAPDRILTAITRHYDRSAAVAAQVRGLSGDERPPVTSPAGHELDARAMLARISRGGPGSLGDAVTALVVHAIEVGAERLMVDEGSVRLVVDGITTEILDLPAVHAAQVVARLRALARLDPGGVRAAAGRAELVLGDRRLKVKASAKPGIAGGTFELDLVDPVSLELPSLGHSRKVAQVWEKVCAEPGLILLVGPLGSGLRATAATVRGAFYVTLKDVESVTAALRAAEAGRTVLGRVVAPGAAEALALLRDWNVPRSAMASQLRALLVQRRLRRVCAVCKLPGEASAEAAQRYGTFAFAAPRAGPGCPACRYRGHSGSFFAAELVVATGPLRDAVEVGSTQREFRQLAVPVADRTLQADAVAHAIAGDTTLSELYRCVPALPAWAVRPAEERHKGLLRAVTQPEAPSPVAEAPKRPARPAVLVVHPGVAERTTLRAALESRADLAFAWSSNFVRIDPERPPVLAVLAWSAPGGWAMDTIMALKVARAKVILLGPPNDLEQMKEAFGLGADDYAGSIEELTLRLGRYLPWAPSAQSVAQMGGFTSSDTV